MKTKLIKSHRPLTGSRLRKRPWVGVLAGFLTTAFASGQTPVTQDGRLFDANPRVGGNRYNYQQTRPLSPLLGGNLIASGNVGYGFALRGYSPIETTTAFRAGLGSGALSNFTRDSVGVSDAFRENGGLSPQVYFDPSRTAPTGAFLQGYYSPAPLAAGITAGASPPSSSGALNPWGGLQYGAPPTPRTTGQLAPRLDSSYAAGNQLNTELSSTIFGVQTIRLPGATGRSGVLGQSTYVPSAPDGFGGPDALDMAAGGGGPLDMRLWSDQRVGLPRSHLSVFAQDDASSVLLHDPAAIGIGLASPTEMPAASPPAAAAPPGPIALPGSDVFTDMQLALELSHDPGAQWFEEMLQASAEADDPARVPELEASAPEAAAEFISRVLAAPITTFAAEGDAPVNAALREAEASMHRARYRDAMRGYERANRLDPGNPLPLLGKGHAALAAGEYMTAAASLLAGLDRFQNIARFDIDLESLLGGGEIVDIRRSDLMKLLARNNEPNLRFLLGYLEYHTGMIESGLKNLDEASRMAKPGDLSRRYADMLRRNSADAATTGENE